MGLSAQVTGYRTNPPWVLMPITLVTIVLSTTFDVQNENDAPLHGICEDCQQDLTTVMPWCGWQVVQP